MPRATTSHLGAPDLLDYKRPFYQARLKREEALADIQLMKRLIKEAKANGFDSAGGGSKGRESGSPH